MIIIINVVDKSTNEDKNRTFKLLFHLTISLFKSIHLSLQALDCGFMIWTKTSYVYKFVLTLGTKELQ